MSKPITRKRMEEIAAEHGLDAVEARVAIEGYERLSKRVANNEKNRGK